MVTGERFLVSSKLLRSLELSIMKAIRGVFTLLLTLWGVNEVVD